MIKIDHYFISCVTLVLICDFGLSNHFNLSGQPPKLNTAPLVQLDTSNKYYKLVVDGMMTNFKKAVNKASEKSFTLSNATSSKPITVIGDTNGQQQKVTINDLQIDGINSPKVSNVYVNKKNIKLHVTFNFKSVRVSGRCTATGGAANAKPTSSASQANSILLEATNWNTSWSANVVSMIGREHFDMNRVYSTHAQQRLSLNLKECPQSMHDKVKSALVERVRSTIDSRLVEIMESVIMQTDTLTSPTDDSIPSGSLNQDQYVASAASRQPKSRGKRASGSASSGASKSGKQSLPKNAPSSLPKAVTKTSSPRKSNLNKSTPKQQGKKSAAVVSGPVKSPRLTFSDTVGKTNTKTSLKQSKASTKTSSAKGSQRVLKRTKRQTPCQQGEELDDYVDQLFRFGTRIVRAMEPITLPNATIELPDYNLKIFLYEGKGTRAYKFRRAKSAWVFCSNETISLGVTVEVEDLRVAYKYRVISGNRLIFDGDLEARLSPKAQAQFSQAVQEEDSEEPVQQRIDRVRLFRLGRVFVLIRGLGNLTQSLSMIINGYLNDNQEELQPTFRMVEGDAVRLLNRFLANVNVPLLSVV